FHENLKAYFPTASADTALTAGLNIGKAPGASFGASPALRPAFDRSSSQSAQGQASRKNANVDPDRCPSFHSLPIPRPVVKRITTDLGSFPTRGVRSGSAIIFSIARARPV